MAAKNPRLRAAALKAWKTRRARGRPRLPKVIQDVEVCFPLRGQVIPMRVTVDFEEQVIRFKARGVRHQAWPSGSCTNRPVRVGDMLLSLNPSRRARP